MCQPSKLRRAETQLDQWLALVPGLASSSARQGAPEPETPAPIADGPPPAGQLGQSPAESSSMGDGPAAVGSSAALIEGVLAHEECHGVIGMPGSYRRLVVTCDRHRGAKCCRKTRAFGARAGQASGLGDLEPHAFLGVWLQASERFGDGAEHNKYRPSTQEVLAYARDRGWEVVGGGRS